MVFYFSENFPHNFLQGALRVVECLADYYGTGELVVYDYIGENYNPVEHRIRGESRRRMLTLIPVSLKNANAFVATSHRHHKPVTGHKF